MGQGTRAHAMAMAVIVHSPMQMLSDPQTDYIREHECSSFLVNIPVEWDETIPLDCKLGEYVSVARKNGSDWYVSAITNWDPREMKISLSFLDSGWLARIVERNLGIFSLCVGVAELCK